MSKRNFKVHKFNTITLFPIPVNGNSVSTTKNILDLYLTHTLADVRKSCWLTFKIYHVSKQLLPPFLQMPWFRLPKLSLQGNCQHSPVRYPCTHPLFSPHRHSQYFFNTFKLDHAIASLFKILQWFLFHRGKAKLEGLMLKLFPISQ